MLYIVDASVIVKWLIPEVLSDKADRFVHAFRAGHVQFLAPDIIAAEVGHSLRRQVLHRELTRDGCFDAIADFVSLAVPTVPSLGLVSRAARLALDHMGSFYDALYLSLAVEHDCPLLTADESMTRAFAAAGRIAPLRTTDIEPDSH